VKKSKNWWYQIFK